MKYKQLIIFITLLALLLPAPAAAAPSTSVTVPGGLTFWVHDVDRNKSVTIHVTDYPNKSDDRFRVELGRIGSAFDPIVVGYIEDEKGKDFFKTFKIPSRLIGETHLAIQIVNVKKGGVGYTIFANDDGYNTRTPLSLSPVHHSSSQSNGDSVGIFDGPDFWVHDFDNSARPFKLTLKFKYYEADAKYDVVIGDNNGNFQGLYLGTIDTSYPKSFTATYDLPSRFWDYEDGTSLMVKVVNKIDGHSGSTAFTLSSSWSAVSPYGLYTTTYVDAALAAKAASSGTPSFTVLNVVKDTEVTLQVYNFPAEKDFTVTMGQIATKGIGGFVIGTQPSGEGGSFIVTYPIPVQLKGDEMIAVRFQSTSSGHYTYNFFKNVDGYNEVTGAGQGTNAGDYILSPGTYPSVVINSVVKDGSVTISGFNFTRHDSYFVRMGPFGTEGIGGEVVRTFGTDGSGTFTMTFQIPESLVGQNMIAIRFESSNTAYYTYNFFYNQ